MKKRLSVLTATVIVSLTLITSPSASALTIGGPSDCDNNAIIRCGAHSTSQLVQAYRSSAYVQKVYTAFGITGGEMARLASTNVSGRVTKDGKVYVDGQSKPVATGAVTGGRQNMPGSTRVNSQGAVFYRRPPSVSFQQASLPAFVSMKNNTFQFAVIASCGNAVRAQATQHPRTAVSQARAVSQTQKPQPKAAAPTQQQQQVQTQSQSVNINNSNTQNIQSAPQNTPEQTPPAAEQPETKGASTLVNTGPADMAGVFLLATIAGTAAYRRWLTRHLTPDNN